MEALTHWANDQDPSRPAHVPAPGDAASSAPPAFEPYVPPGATALSIPCEDCCAAIRFSVDSCLSG